MTLNNPRNRARCSVWGVFDLPGLQPPSMTPEIERDARFGGLSTFLGFDNPRQPPKSSVMLGLGGFRLPWASTSLHDPQQPLKSSAMLGFGGFRPPWASSSLDNPRNRARCSVLGVFDLPGLRAPLTTPEIERDARFEGFSTSLGFNLPPRPSTTPEIEHDARFRPPWASSSLDNPRNRARCSVLGVFDLPGLRPPSTSPEIERDARFGGAFDLPGLRQPSTTPEIERDARFWGFSTSLGFNLPP